MSKLTPSMQDYLEVILELTQTSDTVRSVDIATALGYSRASINKAIGVLKEAGYIEHEHYGHITLTPQGMKEAQDVRRRHDFLKLFLTEVLKVSDQNAEDDACQMEHIVSEETLRQLELFVENYFDHQ